MQCKNCGKFNKNDSSYCIKCGQEFGENNLSKDYCPICNKPLLYPEKPCPYCSDTLEKGFEPVCSQCNIALKKGFIFSNIGTLSKIEKAVLDLDRSKEFCKKCIKDQKNEARDKLNVIKGKFLEVLGQMPILSIEHPENLTIVKYCGVITSQTIVKAGNIHNLISKDQLTGKLSNNFERKLGQGEEFCFNSLKQKSLKLGANAVIGWDIEYEELGGSKKLFLIAMTGTAVIVEEFQILSDYEQRVFNQGDFL